MDAQFIGAMLACAIHLQGFFQPPRRFIILTAIQRQHAHAFKHMRSFDGVSANTKYFERFSIEAHSIDWFVQFPIDIGDVV